MIIFLCLTLSVNLVYFVNSLAQYGDNGNSCVDSCGSSFNLKYKVDLTTGRFEQLDTQLVEILEENVPVEFGSSECSKNVLLRIPFAKLTNGAIVKIELDYGDMARGTSFHFGNSPTNDLYGGDRNTTMFNSEIYSNDTNLSYYMDYGSLCDQDIVPDPSADISPLLLLNESSGFLYPKSKTIVYISEKWFRIDNLERNTSVSYNSEYLFTFKNSDLNEKCKKNPINTYPYNRTSPFLYIGLNRVIADAYLLPGAGLCSANISFLNCHMNPQPDMDINVREMTFTLGDNESVGWVTPLNYLEPTVEHAPCSGEGVVKLRFDRQVRKVARFDLELGEIISGFTFNIGDSPTNNAYGGDSGSTSNSAEIHSNDNRFYVWLNTKYCGDMLLYKIEYSLFQPFDKITIFISDQRIEISNNRGYHEIFSNPYLYNLDGQNVTCNCYDTRCYAGVTADDEIYFGINRVIGGTFRPGVGLCQAKISWLQCRADIKTNVSIDDLDFVDWYKLKENTYYLENEETSGTTTAVPSNTTIDILELLMNSSKEISTAKTEETKISSPVDSNESKIDKTKPLVVNTNVTVLSNDSDTSSKVENESTEDEKVLKNPCTKENIQNEQLYHEYKGDDKKFIHCQSIGKYTIISCPLKMKWSQLYQQCLQE